MFFEVFRMMIFASRRSQFDAAWDIYGEMKALGIAPNCETFNVLIDACSYKRSLSEAFSLVDAMHREGIQPDIVTYNSLIKVRLAPLSLSVQWRAIMHLVSCLRTSWHYSR